ncbi:MAG: hypothetical protein AAB486_01075 [Patescibacteria group bacterium]
MKVDREKVKTQAFSIIPILSKGDEMVQKALPDWLVGKVRGDEVTLALHMSFDVDQVCAVFFMKRFLEGLGLRVGYHFGEPFPVYALPMDIGGGLFDGHAVGLSATFLAAKLTGFLRKYPWSEAVIRDVGQLDAGKKYQGPYLADLRSLSRFVGYEYRQAQSEPGQNPELAALNFGLAVFERILFEARTRDSALDYIRRQGEQALRVIDAGGQGKVILIQAPVWAQPAISDFARREHNPRITISVSLPKFTSVSVLSRKNELDLSPVAAALRGAEMAKRGISLDGYFKAEGKLAFWFVPDGSWLVCCGTPKHPVAGDNMTRLTIDEVVKIVIDNLSGCQKRVAK